MAQDGDKKPKKKTLNVKQQQFVEHYLTCYNATEAARRAGYSEKSASNIGYENVRKPEIAAAISQRLQETAMSADEVLMRLADQARSSMGDFMRISEAGPVIDLQSAAMLGKLHLVRKIKTKSKTTIRSARNEEDEEERVVEVDVELELYDAQAAQRLIGQHHKLFVDRVELAGENGEAIPISIVKMPIDEL